MAVAIALAPRTPANKGAVPSPIQIPAHCFEFIVFISLFSSYARISVPNFAHFMRTSAILMVKHRKDNARLMPDC
jgi:hypothetical protein